MKREKTLLILLALAAILTFAACTTPPFGNVTTVNETNDTNATPTPTVTLTSYPDSARPEEIIMIEWTVDSEEPASTTETALYYDTRSRSGRLDETTSPEESGYGSFTTEYTRGDFDIPADFFTQITIPSDASRLYIRALAVVDGKYYWSEERSIMIS